MAKVTAQVLTREQAMLFADARKTKWAPAGQYVVFLPPGCKGSEVPDDFEHHMFAHRSKAIDCFNRLDAKYPSMVDCNLVWMEADGCRNETPVVRADGKELTYG